MTLTSPIWLLGLIPWAAAAAALLLGRPPRRDVPFLRLWQVAGAARRPPRRRLAPPPAAVAAALAAALAGVVAATGPARAVPGTRGQAVVVVDTGATGSARDRTTGSRRFDRGVAGVAAALVGRPGGAAADDVAVVIVPGATRFRASVADLSARVAALPATALDTTAAVERAARAAAADPAVGVVLVVTDRPVGGGDPRVVRVAPPGAARTVGIRAFAVRTAPRPQAMVRLSTEAWGGGGGGARLPDAVRVRVAYGPGAAERVVPTPAAGEPRDVFLNLPTSRPTAGEAGEAGVPAGAVAALVGRADDLSADDRADLAAAGAWPALEPAGPVGDLRRLIDRYGQARPPSDESVRVRIACRTPPGGAGGGAAVPDGPAVLLPAAGGPTRAARVTTVSAHPIAAAVGDWSALDVPAADPRPAVPAGFTPILADGAGPLVAVRAGGGAGVGPEVRQVWSAVAADGWANRPEYVAFFAAAFDWAGRASGDGGAGDDGRPALAATPLSDWSADWAPLDVAPAAGPVAAWPGLYQRPGDGARRAFGPAQVPRSAAVGGAGVAVAWSAEEVRDRIATIAAAADTLRDDRPWLLVAALALAVGAAATWPGGGGRAGFGRPSEPPPGGGRRRRPAPAFGRPGGPPA